MKKGGERHEQRGFAPRDGRRRYLQPNNHYLCFRGGGGPCGVEHHCLPPPAVPSCWEPVVGIGCVWRGLVLTPWAVDWASSRQGATHPKKSSDRQMKWDLESLIYGVG